MAKRNKRIEFLSMMPGEVKRVLDVGCGDGTWGVLLSQKGIEVTGIERDVQLSSIANKRLNKVFTADIEQLSLPFAKGYFDCLLYADALEHVVDPLKVLKYHGSFLSDKGYILASIPNIRYYKVINQLVFCGVFDYVKSGILDGSHLRFFTLTNIRELFESAGFEIIRLERNIIASRSLKMLNCILGGVLKDFLTYQYYILARKSNSIAFIKRKKAQF
jgi:2-polyprenyl-3-methyl-5-hydroxy-6-metoxy-1,4-benzoquinol methylase